jgi:hypothetical protein
MSTEYTVQPLEQPDPVRPEDVIVAPDEESDVIEAPVEESNVVADKGDLSEPTHTSISLGSIDVSRHSDTAQFPNSRSKMLVRNVYLKVYEKIASKDGPYAVLGQPGIGACVTWLKGICR